MEFYKIGFLPFLVFSFKLHPSSEIKFLHPFVFPFIKRVREKKNIKFLVVTKIFAASNVAAVDSPYY